MHTKSMHCFLFSCMVYIVFEQKHNDVFGVALPVYLGRCKTPFFGFLFVAAKHVNFNLCKAFFLHLYTELRALSSLLTFAHSLCLSLSPAMVLQSALSYDQAGRHAAISASSLGLH